MNSFLVSHQKEDCCGCSACVNVCSHSAISMIADEEGFLYPEKNDCCIDCGLCEKVCPYNPYNIEKENIKQEELKGEYPKTFAAYSNQDRIGSSSGGVFYTLAKYVIGRKGTVYGAAFDEGFHLKHLAAYTIDELEQLRGSKYLQSYIGKTFVEIRSKLKNGEYVFFVGTPCQVAGLKSFLRKDFATLITADLICHGTPSQWMFDRHREYLEKKHKSVLISYHFRDDSGWGGCEIAEFANHATGKKKRVKNPSYYLSPYLYSFMYAYDFRLSCYECPFAKVPRQGDITLGDFWGIQKFISQMDTKHGVSAILVNTPQGESLWNAIKMSLIYEESNYKDVGNENKNLLTHTHKPPIRDIAYKIVRERGYEDVAQKEFRSPKYKKIKRQLFLRKIGFWPFVIKLYRILKRK